MSEFIKYIDSVVGNIARKIEDEFKESDHPRDKGGKFTSKGGEGYMGVSEEELAEEESQESARERTRKEKDDDRVTGPEDYDYMTEREDKHGRSSKKELLPETSKEKAAKEELKGSALKANSKTDKLVSAALEGLMDDTDTAIDFLKGMGGSVKGLEDEDGDIDMDKLGKRIERAIRNNPEDAAEMLGQLGDIYYEEGHGNKSESKENINRLKEIAADGFSDYPDMAQDFLKTMGVKLPKLSREEKEYYEEYPDEYQDLIMEKVHAAIERDPEAAKEALGEWADED